MVRVLERLGAWVGLAGLAPLLYLYVVSGLVVPTGVVGAFLVVWVVLFLTGLRLVRRRPLVVLLLPFLGLALWFAVLWFGDFVLGWTA